ncbi:MAG: HAD family hydrolase [Gaiellaceae bacterium]|jgi:Cof subfamily protein (haloacid dehalogenase superfamily)
MQSQKNGIRLIASDLDGTLLRSDGSVSERTLAALERTVATGIRFVLVSARSSGWLAPEAARLGLGEIAICNNGALVYDIEGERVLLHRPLDPETASDIASGLRRAAPGVAFGCDRPSGFMAEPAYRPLHRPPDSIPRAELDALLAGPITKLVLQHPEIPQAALHRLVVELGGERIEACYSGAGLIEIAAAGVTKGSALAELCAELGIERAETIAFGDMINDIPMLEWAGRGVAVANAHPELLAVANEVTTSNDEDGVALVLERLLDRG